MSDELVLEEVAESLFRTYISGWSQRFLHDFEYKSTIRDAGFGSSSHNYGGGVSAGKPIAKTFDEIKASCIEEQRLWEDEDFPPCDEALFFKKPPRCWPNIAWLRPHEIPGCENPSFIIGEASRRDINQGALGDCWFLAAVACLTQNKPLFHRVVPEDQEFSTNNYAGIFKFNFWQYGRWVEVIIDDKLPTSNGQLIYLHSNNRAEFWPALLEKAYAKLNGNYECLSGGLTGEALVDFTGGLIEKWNFAEDGTEGLFERMEKSLEKEGFIGCSIDATPDQLEARLDNGLVIGHAYSITAAIKIVIDLPHIKGELPMLRIRNPWGNEAEWNGAFSDGSIEWEFISEEERQRVGLTFEADGEFWMYYEDFIANFKRLEICHLGPDSVPEGEGIKWGMSLMEGSWKSNVNAGGCSNYKSHVLNPAYKVALDKPDENDASGQVSLVLGVMQKERRKKRMEGEDNLPIGYAIYKMDDPSMDLNYRVLATLQRVAGSKTFINTREVANVHILEPGTYAIVPSTFKPQQEADFIVRCFTEQPGSVETADEKTKSGEPDPEEANAALAAEKMAEAEEAFKLAAGNENEIDAYELMNLLNTIAKQEFAFEGFNIDLCRSLVAMRDMGLTGRLGLKEFQSLWMDLLQFINIFNVHDANQMGHIDSFELRKALDASGLHLSNSTFNAVATRYSDKQGIVRFNDFLSCAVKLKTMFLTFEEKDIEKENSATFNLDEFIQFTIYS